MGESEISSTGKIMPQNPNQRQIQIKEFAPVLIPTLSRFKHLKACIESLKACTWAEKTEVYIAVDYPPNPSYEEGHSKICSYLDEISSTHPFKKLHIVKRERNLGVGLNGNQYSLIQDLKQKYDRLILSEDDNVFSPAFLDYINKGLELFKDDQSVVAICGYRHFYSIKTNGNTFYRQNVDFSAWGYGIWTDRYQSIPSKLTGGFSTLFSFKNFLNLRNKNGNLRALQFLSASLNKNWRYNVSDNIISIYMGLSGKDVVMPTVSCVKNMGTDGSGINFQKNSVHLQKMHENQELFPEKYYLLEGNPLCCYQENHKVHVTQSYSRVSNLIFLTQIAKIITAATLRKLKIRN